MNIAYNKANTPYVVSYDADILLHIGQILSSVHDIRSSIVDFSYPFNKPLKKVHSNAKSIVAKSLNICEIEHLVELYHHLAPPGGCFFINKEKFIKAGLENEAFISWGPEDIERLTRLEILGYRVNRKEGHIYHLEHVRNENSLETNSHFIKNEQEFNKIKKMKKQELEVYVSEWKAV
jgi:predicted glycosyltransferase involved in capsule biosynthesis